MVEATMDVLDLLRHDAAKGDEDTRTIGQLGLRVFNDFATAWLLASCGYYQGAATTLRDVIETTFLVDLFHAEPTLVAQWTDADHRTRMTKFSPKAVREALDRHDGRTHSKRSSLYFRFCNLATHPTVEGFAMLRPKGMGARNGPFFDVTALRAVLEEAGMLAAHAGHVFALFLDLDNERSSNGVRQFLATAMGYASRFLGINYSDEDRARVADMFTRE